MFYILRSKQKNLVFASDVSIDIDKLRGWKNNIITTLNKEFQHYDKKNVTFIRSIL